MDRKTYSADKSVGRAASERENVLINERNELFDRKQKCAELALRVHPVRRVVRRAERLPKAGQLHHFFDVWRHFPKQRSNNKQM